jgi:HTH-type transcriptional regulator, sugar sensing transcriptional regulator
MSHQEKTLKNLEDLGFSQIEAQIYLLLGKKGPQRAKEIVATLKINRQRLYEVLKELERKGLINSTLEHPAKFGAEPFKKVLDLFVKSKMEEALRIKEEKKNILEDWQLISFNEAVNNSPRFMVLEGRNYIYPRLKQMIEETQNELLLITNLPGLLRAEQYGLIKAAFQHIRKTKIAFKFLTEIDEHNAKSMSQLLEKTGAQGNFEGKSPHLGLNLCSRMLIKDSSEVVFFFNKTNDELAKDSDDICLWTNSSSIVKSFRLVFENLWHSSIDVQSRILEIEKGKQISNTFLINDASIAKAKFEEVIASTKKEIIIATSSSELIKTWRNISFIRDASKRGISVKILAPITREGIEAVIELSNYCQIRHVASAYLETAIVDGEHLFQFNAVPYGHNSGEGLTFENTAYSNERESVQKTKNVLDEIWRNAISPGIVSVENISKPFFLSEPPVGDNEYTVSRKDSPYQKMTMEVEEKIGATTEEYILNKILNPKKDVGVTQRYGSGGEVVIYLPSRLKLPNLIFSFKHCSKQSTFGNEDYMVVYEWIESQSGGAFVPSAIIGDNAESLKHLKEISFARTPAAENTIHVKKNQLQIQIHGNRLFVGWTVNITLPCSNLSIPPASMLFEGYGKIKSNILNFKLPSGVKTILEGNGLDAFVTFFLPNFKYAGPGTDGIFVRDFVMTTTYPSKLEK